MGRVVTVVGGVVVLAGIAVAVVMRTGTPVIGIPAPPPARAQVATLIDGDTIEVRFNDQITHVRLGDIAAPEQPNLGQPPGCLAAQAAAGLAAIIPVGTDVTLTYDRGRYGRTVAQVMTGDGRLVNAEIVRAGLAQILTPDLATPVPPAITAAAQDALANKRGLHSPTIACTVPGQVKALTDQVRKLSTTPTPGADVASLVAGANSATDARAAAEELDSTFTQNRPDIVWSGLDPTERTQLQAQVQAARDRAGTAETVLRNATNISVNQAATQTAAQKETDRIAKALASIRKAEAQRAAEAARRVRAALKAQADAAAEAQTRADAQRKAQRDTTPSSDSPSGSNDNGSHGNSGKKKKKNEHSNGG